ncbi:hypothetical protein T459_30929 [Capsicum annuum]|uniref:Uncharacterized protein n=1 Tax=Capsicum annuum TaxID=4072 RepID=A0A2G2Y9V0_CAPAN|nr:hypothetical protein T459_30929 [Capsicum annuum]
MVLRGHEHRISLRVSDLGRYIINHRWDVDNFLLVLVERGRVELYAESGVTLEIRKDEHSSSSQSSHDAEMTCQICFDDHLSAEKITVETNSMKRKLQVNVLKLEARELQSKDFS